MKLRNRLKVIFFRHIARPLIYMIGIIGESQLSRNRLVKYAGAAIISLMYYILGTSVLGVSSFLSRKLKQYSKPSSRIHSAELRSILFTAMSGSELGTDIVDPVYYRQLLKAEQIYWESQYVIGHLLFQTGQLNLASETFVDLVERPHENLASEKMLRLYRECGVASFLRGHILQANYYWKYAGQFRRTLLGPSEHDSYRILGQDWFAAFGHVAMLDFYIKYCRLYRDGECRSVISRAISTIPASYLLYNFQHLGIVLLDSQDNERLQHDYDLWAFDRGKPGWNSLTKTAKSAIVDEFWEFEFPDGEVLGYTHAAFRIQQEWEQRGNKPLMTLKEEEQKFISRILSFLGVPEDSWYVCLHVREAGFHGDWNKRYPSMRDAQIEDYLLAIEHIVSRGGWIIRMGDNTMKPLPEMPGVVDYAHSPLKSPKADILVPLASRFLIGTNSGYATVAGIYGIPCALTNWVPIGLPLWFSHHLMIPKLFWHEEQQRHLTLEAMFSSGLAFVQNVADIPHGITVVSNTPQDIKDLTDEMLKITAGDPPGVDVLLSESFHEKYCMIAERYGGYVGSRLGSAFIRKYDMVFGEPVLPVK